MKILGKIIPIIILILLLILPLLIRKNLAPKINLDNRTYKLATGAEGGIYKPLGQGLVTLLNQEIPSGNFEMVATGGSVENLNLLAKNRNNIESVDIAFLEGDIALSAFNGEIGLPESTHLRGILALYREFFQVFVRNDSDIKNFKDIADKVVAIGDYGSSLTHNARVLCQAANIDFDKLDKRYMPFTSALKQLENGDVDVVFFFGGGKLKSVESIGKTQTRSSSGKATTEFLKILSLSNETVKILQKDNQPFIPIEITSEDYGFLDKNIQTVGHVAMLVCKDSLADALTAKILEVVLENTEKLSISHPIASEIKEVDQNLMPLPLHSGILEFSPEKIEYFALTIVIIVSVLLLAFLVTMRIVYPASFTRFCKGLARITQGKGYITIFTLIFLFMGIVLLVGSAILTGAETSSHGNHYINYQNSLQSILKVITSGFQDEYMPKTFFGQAIIVSIFAAYFLLLIFLAINILVMVAMPYPKATPAKITIKLPDESDKPTTPSIQQTKDFTKGKNEH